MNVFRSAFFTYSLVGLANTLLHWQIFFVLRVAVGLDQSISNLAAFGIAASFSYYLNALYTFEAKLSVTGYMVFLCAMGALSYAVGYLGDRWRLDAATSAGKKISQVLDRKFYSFYVTEAGSFIVMKDITDPEKYFEDPW